MSERCSPALTRQEPSSPDRARQHSTRAALPGSSRALGHHSPCSFACRSLSPAVHWNQLVSSAALQSSWEPLASLTPFLPPSAPCWRFPCCHHIPSCFLVDPSLCTWSLFSWPVVVPQFPPGSGKRDFAPWSIERGRAASQVPPAQQSPFNSHLIPGNTLCHPRQMLLQHLPAWLPRVSGQQLRAFPFYPHA